MPTTASSEAAFYKRILEQICIIGDFNRSVSHYSYFWDNKVDFTWNKHLYDIYFNLIHIIFASQHSFNLFCSNYFEIHVLTSSFYSSGILKSSPKAVWKVQHTTFLTNACTNLKGLLLIHFKLFWQTLFHHTLHCIDCFFLKLYLNDGLISNANTAVSH